MIHIVGVADMKVSADRDDLIVTYALGSCLGVAIYDPVACVGGLLHVMLPLAEIDPVKAKKNPCMFVNTGVLKLLTECYKAGAGKERLVIKAAGGSWFHYTRKEDHFQIGKRNFIILRKILWKNGLLMKSYDIGGNGSRTMFLDIGRGEVTVRSAGILQRI